MHIEPTISFPVEGPSVCPIVGNFYVDIDGHLMQVVAFNSPARARQGGSQSLTVIAYTRSTGLPYLSLANVSPSAVSKLILRNAEYGDFCLKVSRGENDQ